MFGKRFLRVKTTFRQSAQWELKQRLNSLALVLLDYSDYSEPPLLTQPKVFKFQWLLHLAMLSYRDAEEDGMGSWA